jgi:uncharacterized membrane protein
MMKRVLDFYLQFMTQALKMGSCTNPLQEEFFMWTRAELKNQAKVALKGRYWTSFATYLVFGLISVAASVFSWIPVLGSLVTMAFTFFVANPLKVGLDFYFMQNRLAPPVLSNLFFPFSGGRYMKIVGATAWKTLFIFLWVLIPVGGTLIFLVSFLAVAPSFIAASRPDISSLITTFIVFMVIYIAGMIIVIMKQLAYSMTEYILTDNPYIGYERALKLSISMTFGHKWKIFVLTLSILGLFYLALLAAYIGFFAMLPNIMASSGMMSSPNYASILGLYAAFGWFFLIFLVIGIGLLFIMPYYFATFAELYVRLRDRAIQNGLTTPQELNLIPVGMPPAGPYNAPDGLTPPLPPGSAAPSVDVPTAETPDTQYENRSDALKQDYKPEDGAPPEN